MRGNNGSLRKNLIAEFRRGFRQNYEKALVISMFCSRKPETPETPADELSGLRRDAEAEKRKGRFLVFPRTKEPGA